MTETNPLWRAITLIARHHGHPTDTAIYRATGVAASTLSRVRKRGSARGDALDRLEEAWELPPGTLGRVEEGDLTPEQALALIAGDVEQPASDLSLEFRLRSLESAMAEVLDAVDQLERQRGVEADGSHPSSAAR